MPQTTCCITSCFSSVCNFRLFNFPRSEKMRNLWLSHVLPYCPELANLTAGQLRQRKVCMKHFENTVMSGSKRPKNACPTLFTNKEQNTGSPNIATDITEAGIRTPNVKRKRVESKFVQQQNRMSNYRAAECKGRWEKTRAVSARHTKPLKSDTGTKAKNAELTDAMHSIPFIKVHGTPPENLPSPSQFKEECRLSKDDESIVTDDQKSDCIVPAQPQAPPLEPPPLSIPIPSAHSIPTVRSSQQSELLPYVSTSTKKRAANNEAVDKEIQERGCRQRIKTLNREQDVAKDPKTEALKMFLLSLLPDLRKMTDSEVRQFKRRALDAVDDILSAPSRSTPSSSHSGVPPGP